MFTFYKKYVIIHSNRKIILIKKRYCNILKTAIFNIQIGLWENPTKNPNISHKEKIK